MSASPLSCPKCKGALLSWVTAECECDLPVTSPNIVVPDASTTQKDSLTIDVIATATTTPTDTIASNTVVSDAPTTDTNTADAEVTQPSGPEGTQPIVSRKTKRSHSPPSRVILNSVGNGFVEAAPTPPYASYGNPVDAQILQRRIVIPSARPSGRFARAWEVCRFFPWPSGYEMKAIEDSNIANTHVVADHGYLPFMLPGVEWISAVFVGQADATTVNNVVVIRTLLMSLSQRFGVPLVDLVVVTPVSPKGRADQSGKWKFGGTCWTTLSACQLLMDHGNGKVLIAHDGFYLATDAAGEQLIRDLDSDTTTPSGMGLPRFSMRFQESLVVTKSVKKLVK